MFRGRPGRGAAAPAHSPTRPSSPRNGFARRSFGVSIHRSAPLCLPSRPVIPACRSVRTAPPSSISPTRNRSPSSIVRPAARPCAPVGSTIIFPSSRPSVRAAWARSTRRSTATSTAWWPSSSCAGNSRPTRTTSPSWRTRRASPRPSTIPMWSRCSPTAATTASITLRWNSSTRAASTTSCSSRAASASCRCSTSASRSPAACKRRTTPA